MPTKRVERLQQSCIITIFIDSQLMIQLFLLIILCINTHYCLSFPAEAAHMLYAQNCGKEEYNRCIALADPLVKDPHFIYPGNLKDIDNICR